MDAQLLSQRIADIQQEMEVTKANYAKLEGHLNECSHWLQKMVMEQQAAAAPNPEDVNDNATMDGIEQDKECNDVEVDQQAEGEAA